MLEIFNDPYVICFSPKRASLLENVLAFGNTVFVWGTQEDCGIVLKL